VGSRVLVGLAIGLALLLAMQRWRYAIKIALVLVVIEGALRKWVVPGAQDLAYFAKDIILLGAYVGFLRDETRSRYSGPSLPVPSLLLLLGGLFGLIEVFNPELPTALIGALGWKSYFLYTPLLWVVPAAFRTDEELWRFLRRYVLLAIPIGFLGAAQFNAPTDSQLNIYARGGADADIATFGSANRARVTGTFSYISGYTMYLQVTAVLVLALLATLRWKIGNSRMLFVALGVCLLSMFMTGSRSPVVMMVILIPFYLGLSVLGEKGASSTVLRVAGAAAVIAFLVGIFGDAVLTAFRERAEGSSDAQSRIVEPFVAPVRVMGEVGLFGYGIGATHTASDKIGGNELLLLRMRMPAIEAETGRVMIELGPLGFLLVYLPRFYLIIYAGQRFRRMKTIFHRALGASSFMFLLTQTLGAVVFEATTGFYYWFFAGLLMLAIRLDSEIPVAAPAAVAPRLLTPERALA
jgi:hypothetical protein